jgi:hypothetical protein
VGDGKEGGFMIQEIINYTKHLKENSSWVFEQNLKSTKGLHIFIDFDVIEFTRAVLKGFISLCKGQGFSSEHSLRPTAHEVKISGPSITFTTVKQIEMYFYFLI